MAHLRPSCGIIEDRDEIEFEIASRIKRWEERREEMTNLQLVPFQFSSSENAAR
jgi:hypothetical protein